MNTATIRRNNGRGANRNGTPAPRPRRGKGLFERIGDALPFDEDQLHKLITLVMALVLIALLWLAAMFFGVPAMIYAQISDIAARAGLQVAKVEVHGTAHMDEQPVKYMALDEIDHSMLGLDLPGLRQRIMTMGWVQDARISRRLPDTLVVDIVERKPIAIWQRDGQLALIDATGTVLTGVDPSIMPHLPLVVGPEANHQTAALAKLIEAAPELKSKIVGATWIGNRRWDLKFATGETLALPEGTAEAAAALGSFARMNRDQSLLGRGYIRFDGRDPERFVARVPPGALGEQASGKVAPAPIAPDAAVPAEQDDEGAAPPPLVAEKKG